MKMYAAIAAGCTAFLFAPLVFPCGAPFGSGIEADPQQDIIVVHKNGVETYVFQPKFCGTAKDFGLILPVPSALTQQPALSDQQAFKTVNTVSAPQIVEQTVCYSHFAYDGGRSAGAAPPDNGTTVVSTGHVGFMDFAQLKADTVQSFTDWLTTNGYPYSDAASSVFSYYVQKGWYFVAFRISQSAMAGDGGIGTAKDAGSGTVCNSLGPVKLTFTSDVPVVPSRMANAGSKSSSGSYSSGFSWRIFGVTPGAKQVAFSDGANTSRKLNFSGQLADTDVSALGGLGEPGDRLTKLTLTFSYGSTDPDVGLSLADAHDFRETQTVYHYIDCLDGGLDALPPPDAHKPPVPQDGEAGTVRPDAGRDAGVLVAIDATVSSAGADAAAVAAGKQDATAKPGLAGHSGGGGCSFASTAATGPWGLWALLGLAAGHRIRRVRRK